MDRYADEYFLYLTESKGASANTVDSYTRDINKFIDYLTDVNIENSLKATQTVILNYLLALKKRGKSAATLSRVLSSLKSFYKYLFSNRYIDTDPTVEIHGFKFEKRPPQALSDTQIDLFLNTPICHNIKGYRDKAILELMYATGMRATDIINLHLSDVNLNIGFIFYRSKNKERVIPIYSLAKECVKKYIEKRKQIKNSQNTDILFLNLNGNPLTRQGLYKIVKSYQKISGIRMDITPNTIRDSFAIHLLENGADLKSVQEMMGHSDISSTQVYEQVIKNKLTDVYKKAHPRSKHK